MQIVKISRSQSDDGWNPQVIFEVKMDILPYLEDMKSLSEADMIYKLGTEIYEELEKIKGTLYDQES